MSIQLLTGLLVGAVLTFSFWDNSDPEPLEPESPVEETLIRLGALPMPHQVEAEIPGVSAEAGRDLVLYGIATDVDGNKTQKQSKHFVCTTCHNTQREDPDLSVSDPQARLEYVVDHDLPFLPGTTLYGAVNRSRFYNGDYEKKYGELVEPARHDLREAIQLCAIECSQGRRLQPWELESVLAYLWELELTLADLALTGEEMAAIQTALEEGKEREEAIQLIRSKFLAGSPATFETPPEDRTAGYPYQGDPANGKWIYERACLHCHEGERYSFFNLNDSDYSFSHLERHIDRYTRYSIYQVIRWGTEPLPGKRAYMPNFTLQKMSNQQVEDLRAYIEQRAQ